MRRDYTFLNQTEKLWNDLPSSFFLILRFLDLISKGLRLSVYLDMNT